MDFSDALSRIKIGKKLTRKGWNGKGQFIQLEKSESPDQQRDYISFLTVEHNWVPWVASQTDLLADDWEIVI